MEIGTEISKKIRAAIKGKLQELGAYVDEELPDYIMVMVANKKTSLQMADDLSLFLGSNTSKFTEWLHGVLEKLRSVAVEPTLLRQLHSDSSVPGKSRTSASEDRRGEESKSLAVSSSRSDKTETRVSSSAHENRRGSSEKSSSRLTSTVKPLMEPLPSEAVIDIKPEMDDDLIADEPVEIAVCSGFQRSTAARPTAQVYRPPPSRSASGRTTDTYRSAEGSSHSRQQHSHQQHSSSSRLPRNGPSRQEEASRKRKVPMASSVVRVNQAADEDSDDVEEDDEEDEGYGGRSLSSRVSLPTKPERKPSLPPAKQANRNLILKAISEAQDSITKTTTYQTMPQRQTVPVAPRTRLASSEEMTAAIQLVQEHLQSLAPRVQTYTPTGLFSSRPLAPSRSLASRLQLEIPESNGRKEQLEYRVEVAGGSESKAFDTRSFIMSRPLLEEPPVRNLMSRPPLAEPPVRNLVSRPLLEQPPVRNLVSRPLLEQPPVRNLASRPLLEEPPVRNLMNRPLLEEPPARNLMNRPLLEEPPLRNLMGRTLLEEPPVRNLVSRPLLEERPLRNLVSRPLLEEPPVRDLLSCPLLEEPSVKSRLGLQVKEDVQPAIPRMVQPSKERGDMVGSVSPKFIVTLDGVPSPLGNITDCDMEVDDLRPPSKVTEATVQFHREPKVGILHRLQGGDFSDEDGMEMGTGEEDIVPFKRQKIPERCKFWPVCKSGDECLYHHPKTQCKTFPSCKFGDKCLFVHPNCKYDARCTKPDCPFTHVSRRGSVAPPPKPAVPAPQTGNVCRFFPECKKMDCPFYHPKPCRFAGQCKRAGCTFYHPTTAVPPRHALKWTKTQSS